MQIKEIDRKIEQKKHMIKIAISRKTELISKDARQKGTSSLSISKRLGELKSSRPTLSLEHL